MNQKINFNSLPSHVRISSIPMSTVSGFVCRRGHTPCDVSTRGDYRSGLSKLLQSSNFLKKKQPADLHLKWGKRLHFSQKTFLKSVPLWQSAFLALAANMICCYVGAPAKNKYTIWLVLWPVYCVVSAGTYPPICTGGYTLYTNQNTAPSCAFIYCRGPYDSEWSFLEIYLSRTQQMGRCKRIH